ncbi:uncharacterized protein LOC142356111 [Convolutriloba macropyga]|uniref:uncharacterized protein LOC142356111 n=1 Tax=Convolutriloba macropyga TaxID=536237 RepID=UPI003F524477
MGSGSMFSLGYTAGQSFNHINTWGVADPMCNSKAIKPFTRDDRVVMLLAKKRLLHDVESNPGPQKFLCTECKQPIKRSQWSVKCNGCRQWIHWDCTDLGQHGRWNLHFRGKCCEPPPPRAAEADTPTYPIEGQQGENDPGPQKFLCTECKQPIKRSQWSVKCNGCRQWIHWDCTDLGQHGRWNLHFRGKCCEPPPPRAAEADTPTYPIEGQQGEEAIPTYPTEGRQGRIVTAEAKKRRRKQKHARRRRRQAKRDQKWQEYAERIGREKVTPIWTWNVQRARASFPRKNRFMEILKVIAENNVEVVMLSEMLEQYPGIKWVKSRELYGVLVHGKRSGVFLKGEWAVKWKQQGCKKTLGDRNTAVDVDGNRFVSTYKPLWNGDSDELLDYKEELQAMLHWKGKIIVGGDFNSSVGNTEKRGVSNVAGAFGLGTTNTAGVDLINWCNEFGLCWTSSFFRQAKPGTWRHPRTGRWHEIDGFLVRQEDRSRWVRKIKTIQMRHRLSDHDPKYMLAKLTFSKKREPNNSKPKCNINWDKLKIPEVAIKFREGVDKAVENSAQTLNWMQLMKTFREAGAEHCGKKEKAHLNPWLDTHQDEMEAFQRELSGLTERIKTTNSDGRELAREQRRDLRKKIKYAKTFWEEEWWLEVVEEAKKAEVKGDVRALYKTLRRIGVKDSSSIEEEYFTPEEFRTHFMKVSEDRFERPVNEILKTAETTSERTANGDADILDKEISWTEFERELTKIKDGAPGVENVRVSALKCASPEVRTLIYQCILDLLAKPVNEWPNEVKEGWVIPLHKKGAKNDLNNYRGVCLLPLASRIIARIMASRLRNWSEEIGVLGENQNGFRSGRSTADATQIAIRVEEETRRVLGREECEKRPGAVLLDITKAYPRVNKPLLWTILKRLGMSEAILTILKNLHEETAYRVKGREELSQEWTPQRGLREGCATSPILFNIYHAESMRLAQSRRQTAAELAGKECGLKWSWSGRDSLPPLSTSRALRSADRELFTITDSLFADDSTLIGWTDELMTGKEEVKAAMSEFEERCHDGKEEFVVFGTETADKTRMLGTRIGKKQDLAARINRGNATWNKVRKWFWKSNLSKRTRAVIVQATVEATLLFDCTVHPWNKSEIRKLQSVADKAYRWIWNEGRGLSKIRMQKEGVNAFGIRKKLQIASLRCKIETRSLQRIGHILRMPDARTVKRAVLGQWDHRGTGKGKLRGGTISIWRRLLGEANIDWTNVGNMAKDRKVWKSIVQARRTFLESWEDEMCQWKRGTSAPNRSQRKKRETGPWLCRWEGCSTQCRTKTGLTQHERAHEKKTVRLSCSQCHRVFARQCNLTNHAKICKGASMNECLCGRKISEGNMTRHIRESCPLREHKIKPKRLNSLRVACPECGSLITSSNLSRHRKNLHGL